MKEVRVYPPKRSYSDASGGFGNTIIWVILWLCLLFGVAKYLGIAF